MSKSEADSTLPAILSTGGGALTNTTGTQRIATRMAENLLGVARSQERALTAQRRYRIGDYEFREADHEQIQRWTRMLGMEPEKVVEVLASSQKKNSWDNEIHADFRVVDGAIVSLVWDFALLPLTDWAWGQGVRIARLGILNAPSESLPLLPECLDELFCYSNRVVTLTLSQVPNLKKLNCGRNLLTELDLTPVSGLQMLDCGGNKLTELDLTPVSGLQVLNCGVNVLLTELDLTPVSGLQVLNCGGNVRLTELDLTPVSGLQQLFCISSALTKLDLTPVPELKLLFCSNTALTELDLTPVPGLQKLSCIYTKLIELDLLPVPGLQELLCNAFVKIKNAPPNLKVSRK